MEREPKAWRSLFPWGQRVNLPAMVVRRPRLHVLVVGTRRVNVKMRNLLSLPHRPCTVPFWPKPGGDSENRRIPSCGLPARDPTVSGASSEAYVDAAGFPRGGLTVWDPFDPP